jgi:hypothetical protein
MFRDWKSAWPGGLLPVDVDLLVLDETGRAQTVIIQGEVHVRDAMVRGTFET